MGMSLEKIFGLYTVGFLGVTIVIGIGEAIGLFSNQMGTFTCTPKLNVIDPTDRWIRGSYHLKISRMVLAELFLGVYALVSATALYERLGWGIAPWLLFYAVSFFYIAGTNLLQTWQTSRVRDSVIARA